MSVFPKLIVLFVAVGACLGADYFNQASRAGATPSEFGAENYVGSMQDRYHEWVNDQARDKKPLIAFLPEPTGNWKKEAWSRELDFILKTGENFSVLRDRMLEIEPSSPNMGGGVFNLMSTGWSSKSRDTVIYYRGNEIIEVKMRRIQSGSGIFGASKAMDEVARDMMDSVSDLSVFARIRGVRYIESNNIFAGLEYEGQPDHRDVLRSISGELGNSVEIEVRARAQTTSIKLVLARIDYDGILAQLDEDVRGVGNHVVNSLPQIKDLNYRAIERHTLAEEKSEKAETALDRLLALFGIKRDAPEKKRAVVVNRAGKEGCSGLARSCKGKMQGERF